MDNDSDEKLVEYFLEGEKRALEVLVFRYYKVIYNFCYRYVGDINVAEDITQESFVKAWKNLNKFDRSKKFKTWMFQIAKNTCIDYLRKRKSIPFSRFENEDGDNNFVDNFEDILPLPDEIFKKKDLAEFLEKAISKLPDANKMVVLLYYKNDFNFREIAEILNEPIDTIKSRYRRGLVSLRKLIGDYEY
ncbi:MAG: RNA polymerase sigma factor [Candidatus Paceibacterota bacterium]|jgi:RNA polymerase sigma-70 factor (ECF subfamily)|nr:RNA polymerase sigma factor [bacterium]